MDMTEFIAFGIVALVMIGLPIGAFAYQEYLEAERREKQPKEVNIFAWANEYGGWTPDRIVVKKGEPVKIIIWARDTAHSLVIPDLGIESGPIEPGKRAVIEFTPDKVGTFTFYCGTVCSPKHHFMRGAIIVEE